ncbi:MAG TPA: hypothetical protein VEH27_13410 [Methylomirabilota bacterium]|nr:hypothetical protein [Methylomirabilota bacterium]
MKPSPSSFVPFREAFPQARSGGTRPAHPISTPGNSADPAENHTRSVEVVKEGGIVQKIRVQCSCGEVIEITCEY